MTAETATTVADYVVRRLAALGIRHAFGVPGDYTFAYDDALDRCPGLTSIGCANELNAAYAADGYARVNGAAILCTTYGVGELSALNGVMGSKAERLPVFHLVGAPSLRLQRNRAVTHHTLGDAEFGRFSAISAQAACVSVLLNHDNVVAETERAIGEALARCQPAYLALPHDQGQMAFTGSAPSLRLDEIVRGTSQADELAAALTAIGQRLASARAPVAFVSHVVARYRLQAAVLAFLARSGMGYVTTTMDKAVLSESDPHFLGMYAGSQSAPSVRAAVEGADCILDIGGVVWSDFNTGLWTQKYDPRALIELHADYVRVGERTFGPVALGDVLAGLAAAARVVAAPPAATAAAAAAPLAGAPSDRITTATLYPRLQSFLRERDTVFAETGSCVAPLAAARLPADALFFNQTLWGSIGWATPAAFGGALADPTRRTVLVTGDGAHQLTANELGTISRYGAKPVIFVVNNSEYMVEEELNEVHGHRYDELTRWRYHLLPAALGCAGWYAQRVTTVGDLEAALSRAGTHDAAAYIEVVLDPKEAPLQLPQATLESLYQVAP